MRFDFMWWSNGASVFREGDKFTSSSHGFNSLSSRISNPNKSKQLFGPSFSRLQESIMGSSAEMTVLMIRS